MTMTELINVLQNSDLDRYDTDPWEFVMFIQSFGVPLDATLIAAMFASSLYGRENVSKIIQETDVFDEMLKDHETMGMIIRELAIYPRFFYAAMTKLIARRPGIVLGFYLNGLESLMRHLGHTPEYLYFESIVFKWADQNKNHPDFPKGLWERILKVHESVMTYSMMTD